MRYHIMSFLLSSDLDILMNINHNNITRLHVKLNMGQTSNIVVLPTVGPIHLQFYEAFWKLVHRYVHLYNMITALPNHYRCNII